MSDFDSDRIADAKLTEDHRPDATPAESVGFVCPHCGDELIYYEEHSNEYLYCERCMSDAYDVDTGERIYRINVPTD